jgi:uncharacterized protein (DUF58 family)
MALEARMEAAERGERRTAREEVSSRPVSREVLHRIRQIEIITNRLVNDQLAGQYHSVFKGRGMSFDEVRPYQPGDEIRQIDWNVSARTGDIFVKQFVEERELTILLVVDASASQSFGTREQTKVSDAAWLSALIGFSAIRNHDRVGLIAFAEQDDDTTEDEVLLFIPPKKGRSHCLRLVRDVMALEEWAEARIARRREAPRQDARTRLETALGYLNRVTKRRSVAFLISDFRAEGFTQALGITAQRHDLIPIVTGDPGEETLLGGGLTFFEDPETGDLFPGWVSARSARRHALAEARRKATLKQTFARYGMTPILLPAGDGGDLESRADRYAKALVNYFRIRAKRL